MKKVSECETSVDIWMMLKMSFVSHSRGRIFQYKSELNNIKRSNISITEYAMKIKEIVMQLSTCGYLVSGEDQIHVLLNGVDKDYDLVHATISNKID